MAKAYRAYRLSVERYMNRSECVPPRVALPVGDGGTSLTLRLLDSVLFRKKYLIGFVEDGWFAGDFPGHDAVACVVRNDVIPPLALIPRKRMRSRSEVFHSILEHELIHVNQAIKGTLPSREPKEQLRGAISAFFDVVRSEYDANFLQLARWPGLFPQREVKSLEYWCALRGLGEATEAAVTGAFCSSEMLPSLLTALPDSHEEDLAKYQIDGSLASSLAKRLGHFVCVAVQNRIEAQPNLARNASILAAQRWIREFVINR